jgi:23S rRNA (guanine745-N1)-methyltransferase
MALTPDEVDALIRMGPSARHLRPDELVAAAGRLAASTRVTLEVTISVFEKE